MIKLKKFGFFFDETTAKLDLSKLKRDVPHNMEQNILNYLNGGHKFLLIMGISRKFHEEVKKLKSKGIDVRNPDVPDSIKVEIWRKLNGG